MIGSNIYCNVEHWKQLNQVDIMCCEKNKLWVITLWSFLWEKALMALFSLLVVFVFFCFFLCFLTPFVSTPEHSKQVCLFLRVHLTGVSPTHALSFSPPPNYARPAEPPGLCDGRGGDRQHRPAGLEPWPRQRQPHCQLLRPDQDPLHRGLAEGKHRWAPSPLFQMKPLPLSVRCERSWRSGLREPAGCCSRLNCLFFKWPLHLSPSIRRLLK